MNLTFQIHVDGEWHDAAMITFEDPKLAIMSQTMVRRIQVGRG